MKKIALLFALFFTAATASAIREASAQVVISVNVTTYAFPCEEIVRTINGFPTQVYDPVCVNRIVDPVEFVVEPAIRANYLAAVNACYFPGTAFLNPACIVAEDRGPWLMIRDRWAPIHVENWPRLVRYDYHPIGRGIDRPVVDRDRGFPDRGFGDRDGGRRGGHGGRGDLEDLNKTMDEINGIPATENASVKQSNGLIKADDTTTESAELKAPVLGLDSANQAL